MHNYKLSCFRSCKFLVRYHHLKERGIKWEAFFCQCNYCHKRTTSMHKPIKKIWLCRGTVNFLTAGLTTVSSSCTYHFLNDPQKPRPNRWGTTFSTNWLILGGQIILLIGICFPSHCCPGGICEAYFTSFFLTTDLRFTQDYEIYFHDTAQL